MGRSEADKLVWMNTFVGVIQTAAATYFLTAPDVAAISGAVQTFADAKTIADATSTRTKGTIANKNDALAAAVGICRQYAKMIKYNAGISDQAKIDVNIKPPTTTSEPRPCPVGAPTISVVAATVGAHTLSYADTLEQDMRRKPVGADGILLFRAIADEAVADIGQAQFYRKYTTKPMPVFFDGPDRGRTATYFARWVGQRGDMGAVSAPVSMPIAA